MLLWQISRFRVLLNRTSPRGSAKARDRIGRALSLSGENGYVPTLLAWGSVVAGRISFYLFHLMKNPANPAYDHDSAVVIDGPKH